MKPKGLFSDIYKRALRNMMSRYCCYGACHPWKLGLRTSLWRALSLSWHTECLYFSLAFYLLQSEQAIDIPLSLRYWELFKNADELFCRTVSNMEISGGFVRHGNQVFILKKKKITIDALCLFSFKILLTSLWSLKKYHVNLFLHQKGTFPSHIIIMWSLGRDHANIIIPYTHSPKLTELIITMGGCNYGNIWTLLCLLNWLVGILTFNKGLSLLSFINYFVIRSTI